MVAHKYRVQHRMIYGWDFVNEDVYDSYNEAVADLNDMLLTATDEGMDVDPDDWRVVLTLPQDGSTACSAPLAS